MDISSGNGIKIVDGSSFGPLVNHGVIRKGVYARETELVTPSLLPSFDSSNGITGLKFTSSSNTMSGFMTAGSIDITLFKTLTITQYIQVLHMYFSMLDCWFSKDGVNADYLFKGRTAGENAVHVQVPQEAHDISNINGHYYFGCSLSNVYTGSGVIFAQEITLK